MKNQILFFIVMIISSVNLFCGEIIDGKKVFSNEEIIESFNGGSVSWNKFRSENEDVNFGELFEKKDFKNINMAGYNLKGMNFTDSNMAGAKLDGANMQECNLQNVNLYNADLKRANLYRANLLRANLDSTALYNANMEDAKVDLKWKDRLQKRNIDKFNLIDWKR